MSAETLASYITHTRDRDTSLRESWFARHGDKNVTEDEYFELCSLCPFEELTPDDLLWCFVAALEDRFATHLVLHIFPSRCEDTEETYVDLIEGFIELGFTPFEVDIDQMSDDVVIVMSVFSKTEGRTAYDLFYRRS